MMWQKKCTFLKSLCNCMVVIAACLGSLVAGIISVIISDGVKDPQGRGLVLEDSQHWTSNYSWIT